MELQFIVWFRYSNLSKLKPFRWLIYICNRLLQRYYEGDIRVEIYLWLQIVLLVPPTSPVILLSQLSLVTGYFLHWSRLTSSPILIPLHSLLREPVVFLCCYHRSVAILLGKWEDSSLKRRVQQMEDPQDKSLFLLRISRVTLISDPTLRLSSRSDSFPFLEVSLPYTHHPNLSPFSSNPFYPTWSLLKRIRMI